MKRSAPTFLMLSKRVLTGSCITAFLFAGMSAAQQAAPTKEACSFNVSNISFDHDPPDKYIWFWDVKWDVCSSCSHNLRTSLRYDVILSGYKNPDGRTFRRTHWFSRNPKTFSANSCIHEGTSFTPEAGERYLSDVSMDVACADGNGQPKSCE